MDYIYEGCRGLTLTGQNCPIWSHMNWELLDLSGATNDNGCISFQPINIGSNDCSLLPNLWSTQCILPYSFFSSIPLLTIVMKVLDPVKTLPNLVRCSSIWWDPTKSNEDLNIFANSHHGLEGRRLWSIWSSKIEWLFQSTTHVHNDW